MTRRQRAVASAAGIIPATIAGVALVRCGSGFAAYIIEIATAVVYIIFILTAPRGQA
jgi:hypothetical protein